MAISNPYWNNVKKQFAKNKRAVWAAYTVLVMGIIAVFADFIANEKPVVVKYQNQWYCPVLQEYGVQLHIYRWPVALQNIAWNDTPFDFVVRPPIPYSPTTQDFLNSPFVSPFESQQISSWRWRHWLGTESIGRDILAALIHGTRIAFAVGIISMSIATLIGILMGALAGFFGDDTIRMTRAKLLGILMGIFIGFFYAFQVRGYVLSDALAQGFIAFLGALFISLFIFSGILVGCYQLGKLGKHLPFFRKEVFIPLDLLVLRIIEVMVSVPKIFLIIAIVAIAKPSIFLVMAVIGLTSWTEIARFIRAELLKIKNLEYIESVKALGLSKSQILLKHAIPNALPPVLISISFGIAAAILVESFLSFIGLGLPAEVLTWGKLLALARGGRSELWVALFPGFAIFITVTLFNLLGEGLTDALDPKQKQ